MMIHDGDSPDLFIPSISSYDWGKHPTCVFRILNLMLDNSEDIYLIYPKRKHKKNRLSWCNYPWLSHDDIPMISPWRYPKKTQPSYDVMNGCEAWQRPLPSWVWHESKIRRWFTGWSNDESCGIDHENENIFECTWLYYIHLYTVVIWYIYIYIIYIYMHT